MTDMDRFFKKPVHFFNYRIQEIMSSYITHLSFFDWNIPKLNEKETV